MGEPVDKNKCPSCGVLYTEHLGLVGTCAQLHEMMELVQTQTEWINLAADLLRHSNARAIWNGLNPSRN